MQNHGLAPCKRILDLCTSVFALAVLSPLLLAIAGITRWKLGSPILFRQLRAGMYGRPFHLLKFRTMTETRRDGVRIPDVERLTAFGSFLRNSSLDELPQLINVLRGEMSLVGPRPLLMEYLPRYSPTQRRRHDVLPGITGLAQVRGRNALSWSRKFALDLWYVKHRSFWLDLQILVLTACQVARRQGISQKGIVGAEEFSGSSPR